MIRSAFLPVCCGNRQTDEIRRESPWTMVFADDLAICGGEQGAGGEDLLGEGWRYKGPS